MRIVWNLLFIMVLALLLGYGEDMAFAKVMDHDDDFVDGDPGNWGFISYSDSRHDVAPDANNSIDIIKYDFSLFPGGSRFPFIFQFLEPPFQGSTQTSVELFFDVSGDPDFGDTTPPWDTWDDFRPDYRIEIIGQNGRLTKEVFRRWVGDQWVVMEDEDLFEMGAAYLSWQSAQERREALRRERDEQVAVMEGEDLFEVEVALSGQWLEGTIEWYVFYDPTSPPPTFDDIKRGAFSYFKWAVRTTQDGSHDYVLAGSPAGIVSVVNPQSWGSIKHDQSQGGLE